MKKRVISLLVCLSLALALVPALSQPAAASTNGHTQAEAVAWVKNQIGKYLDYDGAYGAQCVDLIKYYYAYLGNGKYAKGNATTYQSNAIPSGWTRVKSAPQPGDVIVWGGGTKGSASWTVSKYGHVGIVIAVNGDKLTTVEQNINGSPCKQTTRSASYATCFIRPDFTPDRVLTISHNVNGGRLDSTEYKATAAGIVQKGGKDVTTKWAYGTGGKNGLYNATTFGLVRDGYAFVGWSLSKDGSSTVFDQDNVKLKAEDIYPKVKDGSASVTLYAVWEPAEYTLRCYYNDSGKNYLYRSDFSSGLDANWWQSRDTAVSTISVDSSERHNGHNSLKIVNAAAGASGKDLAFQTLTQGNQKNFNFVGDNKAMTLSFWAKSSKDGTKMFFRWGYESNKSYRSVTLTTGWKKYTVSMDKTAAYGPWIHPYVDSAGTVWLSELQLEDGSAATDFVPETGGMYTSAGQQAQTNYALPEAPVREGYTFDGWYTAANGGEEITASTPVKNGNFSVYAHWTKGHTHAYTAGVTAPTCTESGHTVYTCEACGDSYVGDTVAALGHSYDEGVCTRCGEIDKNYTGEIDETARPEQPAVAQAMPTNDKLTANGKVQNATVYKINGSNYFKIRDLAAILNGTGKQFEVGYDGGTKSVTAETGKAYTSNGTELKGAPAGGNKTAVASNDTIYINGVKADVEVYKIDGSNYFKLRDLGKTLNFYVGWTKESGMFIDTSKPYSE